MGRRSLSLAHLWFVGISCAISCAIGAVACGLSVEGGASDGPGSPSSSSSSSSASSASSASSSGGGGDASIDEGGSTSSSSSSSSGADGSVDGDTSTGCGDVTTNAKNCGACNHDCLGGACVLGECQPIVFAAGENGCRGVAVAGANLLWTRGFTVRRAPLTDGSTATTLIASVGAEAQAGAAFDVATNGVNIFVSQRGIDAHSGRISKWDMNGLAAGPFIGISPFTTASGIWADATTVYFTVQQEDGVTSASTSDFTNLKVRAAQNYPQDVVVVGTTMYFASGSGIVSTPLGMNQQTILSPVSRFQDVATAGPDLIHTGLAVDGPTIFFTISDKNKNIVASVPTSGGVAKVLASGQPGPEGIAATATAIYWANNGNGTIMKLAR